MKLTRDELYTGLITVLAICLLYVGWRLFWFLTDDAFIAFRYVTNSLAGFGYVWNPPPFYPVEGYTSFLWVLILDGLWRFLGIAPTTAVNWVSLFFSGLTLVVIGWSALRLRLSDSLARFRPIFLALILLGILSNRTFLAWTSSGLETALFNFLIISWALAALIARVRGRNWMALLTLLAALAALTRPDGLLILGATIVMAVIWFRGQVQAGRLYLRDTLTLLPFTLPIIHLFWRRATYGEWLPNTYYAKYVAPWPEAGLRYLGSFIVEYTLWVWLVLLVWAGVRWATSRRRLSLPGRTLTQAVVLATIVAHIAYYTLVIGGDHFEYRVYSYLIPLIFLSTLWLLDRVVRDRVIAACTVGLFIILSWMIPWTHWSLTQNKWTERETRKMFQPVAGKFPTGTRWYAESFDQLQSWLISHSVCARHQAHKAFTLRQLQRYPSQPLEVKTNYPLLEISAVGVAGWALPNVAIIDALGLNDHTIARSPVRADGMRTMAHERVPPVGYLQSFPVSITYREGVGWGTTELETELSDDEIVANETFWRELVVKQNRPEIPATTLMRQGEFEARNRRYINAVPLLQAALERDSNLCGAYSLLAVSYVQLGLRDSALALIGRMPGSDDCTPLALTRMGRIAVEAGYAKAEEADNSGHEELELGQQILLKALSLDGLRTDALISMASVTLFKNQLDSTQLFLSRVEQSDALLSPQLEVLAAQYRARGLTDLAHRVDSLIARSQ